MPRHDFGAVHIMTFPGRVAHEWVEEHAIKTPDAVAIATADEQLTYAELNTRADALAAALLATGLARESVVAVLLNHTPEHVVALLAVLKAGGTFLPIDPALPHARIEFILTDAAPAALICARDGAYPVAAGVPVLEVPYAATGARPPRTPVSADALAYAIYTSGSTGVPKAALLHYGGLANLIEETVGPLGVVPDTRFLQFSSSGFDASIWEIFLTLRAGATLYICPPEQLHAGIDLERVIQEGGITHVLLPPSVLATLDPLSVPGLRTVIVGGEVCGAGLAARWSKHFRFFNAYGPTEATVCTTMFECSGEESPVPIGRPIGNAVVRVLDDALQEVPAGEIGELVIGGPGVARGYLHRPELTAERFRTLDARFPQRVYRTGDLGRYRADGVLEYLGRRDEQVKVAGVRIELGEIETVLARHERIESVAVVLSASGESRKIVAFCQMNHDAADLDELREFASRYLPRAMVPALFVPVERFPLTPNGKIDKAALTVRPDPPVRLPVTREDHTREQSVAAVWREVLHVGDVAASDNFFALGGDSLSAAVMVRRLASEAGGLTVATLFSHPTLSDFARQVETLSADAAPVPRRRPAVSDGVSYCQERFWFLSTFGEQNAAYKVFYALHLQGALDLRALERAVTAIVERYPILRSTFRFDGERLSRHTDGAVPLVLVDEQVDVPDGDGASLQERVQRIAAAMPCDAAAGPLFGVRLIRSGPTEHALLLAIHHLVCDADSMRILLAELSLVYANGGDARCLADRPATPFDRFVEAERADEERGAWNESLAFWREHLAGVEPLHLPGDSARASVTEARGGFHRVVAERELLHRLRETAGRHGTTPYCTLLTAFLILLSRYTRQRDILIGIPMSVRSGAEFGDVVGPLINTVPCRVQFPERVTGAEALDLVTRIVGQLQRHQHAPLQKILSAVKELRDPGVPGLFEVLFNHVAGLGDPFAMGEVMATPLVVDRGAVQVDFSMTVEDSPEQLALMLEFNAGRFEAATVARLAGHYLNLLRALVRALDMQPNESIDALAILDAAEEAELLRLSTGPAVPAGDTATMAEAFERQAALTPDAVAVACGSARVSYGELNAMANQLAHHLVSIGVAPRDRIGILTGRSIEMVAGVLAVLKASATFVPLDGRYPDDRLAWLVSDAGVRLVLTQGAQHERHPAGLWESLDLDRREAWSGRHPAGNLPPRVGAGDVAYVIYTSGSTGRPKGVAIEHRNALNLVTWAAREYGEDETRAVLASTPLIFDLSIFELFVPLTRGGCVVVVQDLISGLERPFPLPVTLINTVPSVIREALLFTNLPDQVVTVNVAGEILPADLLQAVLQKSRVRRVCNLYAPSETTTYSTIAGIERPGEKHPTIGRPIDNTQVLLLDESLALAPRGGIGEICIGGAGVARGYINRPDLTASRFVEHRHGRVYRTGDLGRYRPDGDLEFLGRVDEQVKVRGHRVEPAELEGVICELDAVAEAAVVVRDSPGGTRQLAAFVSCRSGAACTIRDVRAVLEKRLPSYLIPSEIRFIETLPRTASGKIDRKALRATALLPAAVPAVAAPRRAATAEEATVAEIWGRVLALPDVPRDMNFFDLGGDSLLLGRVLRELQSRIAGPWTLTDLFRYATVESLAEHIRRMRAAAPEPSVSSAPAAARGRRGGNQSVRRAALRSARAQELPPEDH